MANRIALVLIVALLWAAAGLAPNPVLTAAPQATSAAGGPPALGKWVFTGKDKTGLAWTGTLTLGTVDPARFDATKYFAICSLEVESTDPDRGTRGVEAPCEYDAKAHRVSFSIAVSRVQAYTAVLSPDGGSLTNGTWSTKKGATIVDQGEWSAKPPARP